MHARVTIDQVKSGQMERAIRAYEQTSVRANQQDPGFLRNLLLTDPESGTAIGITIWESEHDLKASQAAHEGRTQQAQELVHLG